MFTSWLKPAAPTRRKPVLEVRPLEDRTVPATFYVDPTFSTAAPGDTVNFTPAGATPVNGLIFGASLADFQADPTTSAFSDMAVALQVSEASPGDDTILLGRGPITLTTPTTTVGSGVSSALPVTQGLTVIGLGAGASVLNPTGDTTFDGALDGDAAVIAVTGPGGRLTATDFRLDGSGGVFSVGTGFLVEAGATASFSGVSVSSVLFGNSTGDAVAVTGGSTLTFADGTINGYGRTGVFVQDSTATITGTTLIGLGSGDFINNGVEANGSSTVLISGSTIVENAGTDSVDGSQSAGVLATANGAVAPTITVIGSLISGNALGLALSGPAGNTAVINAQYNNIVDNEVALDATFAATNPGIVAPNNFFGDATGPFEATANPLGRGNPVTGGGTVQFTEFLSAPTPVASAATVPAYLDAITTLGVTVTPTGPAVVTTTPTSVSFTVTFAQPVTGFDAADVIASLRNGDAIDPSPAVTVTGSGATYTVTVNGTFSNDSSVGVTIRRQAAASSVDGTLSVASNTATVTVAVPVVTPPTPPRVGTTINPVGNAVLPSVPTNVQFNVTFTEAVTGFDINDVTATATSGAATAVTVTGSGAAYTVTVSGAFTTADTISVSVRDAAAQSAAGGATFAGGPATISIQVPTTTTVPGPPVPVPVPVPVPTPGPPVPVPVPVPTPVPTPRTTTRLFAVGAGAGGFPEVQVFGSDGLAQSRFLAYEPSFTGGVQVATGDLNGDGTDDIVTGAGPGGGPRVRVYDGATGALLANYFAYEPSARSGVFVTVGDVNGDGVSEVITGAGVGGGPVVRVFDASGRELYSFFALEAQFRGGVTVAAGDLDGDGVAEIVAAAGAGGGPRIVVLNSNGTPRTSFFAYEQSFGGGVTVAVNPAAAGGVGSIVTGPGTGRAPEVRQFSPTGAPVNAAFAAYESQFTGGVRVAVGDTNRDGVSDIITGTGRTGGPRVRGFNPTDARVVFDRFVFDGVGSDGLFVG